MAKVPVSYTHLDVYKRQLNDIESVGPILMGMDRPVHIVQLGARVDEMVNMTTIAVVDAQEREKKAVQTP